MRRAILRAPASHVRMANGSGRACYNEVASVSALGRSLAPAEANVHRILEACDQALAGVQRTAVRR